MYAAQEIPRIDAARAEKDPFRTETSLMAHNLHTIGSQAENKPFIHSCRD
jgi:hypothetical protein